MKKMLLILLLPIMGLMAVACSDSDSDSDSGKSETSSLVLSADRNYIIANGSDKVTFTVKSPEGEDLTLKCVFNANDVELVDNTLSAKTPGTYKVSATYKGVTSNVLDVVAMGENVKLKIVADKKSIIADGGDFACLYLEDEHGSRITDGVFYVDGEKLEKSYFGTKKTGMHTVTATWNGQEVDGSLKLAAFSNGDYTPRMLIESLTGTSCQYCTSVLNVLTEGDKIARTEPRIVLIEVHYERMSSDMWYRYDERSRQMEYDFIGYYGSTGVPSVYLDRKKEKYTAAQITKPTMLSSIKSKTDVAIAIKNTVSGTDVKVEAVVASKRDLQGKVLAVLVEDGIYLEHVNLGMIEWYHTMRDYRPSFTGGDAVSFKPGEPKTVNFTIPLGKAVAENSKIIVFVLNESGLVENVQQVAVGSSIGY